MANFLSAPSSFMLATPLLHLLMILTWQPLHVRHLLFRWRENDSVHRDANFCLSLSSPDNEVFITWGEVGALAETGEIMTVRCKRQPSKPDNEFGINWTGRSGWVARFTRFSGSNENSGGPRRVHLGYLSVVKVKSAASDSFKAGGRLGPYFDLDPREFCT